MQVAQKHYWQVTDADFEKATQNTTQHTRAEGSTGSQAIGPGTAERLVLLGDAPAGNEVPNRLVGDTGLEPVTPSLSS